MRRRSGVGLSPRASPPKATRKAPEQSDYMPTHRSDHMVSTDDAVGSLHDISNTSSSYTNDGDIQTLNESAGVHYITPAQWRQRRATELDDLHEFERLELAAADVTSDGQRKIRQA